VSFQDCFIKLAGDGQWVALYIGSSYGEIIFTYTCPFGSAGCIKLLLDSGFADKVEDCTKFKVLKRAFTQGDAACVKIFWRQDSASSSLILSLV